MEAPTVVDGDSVKVIACGSPVQLEISEQVAKFVSGDPIEKQNPFYKAHEEEEDEADYLRLARGGRVVLTNRETEDDDDDEGDISTEDVLNQSKYVKTYIKNPDKYFTLDTDAIKRIQREERAKPVPLRRRLINNQSATAPSKVTKKRWIADKYHVYPDLSDIKVRVGAATDPDDVEYYNPAEVKFNAAQFDDRFKAIKEFGSQDDIDTIAERTDALDGDSTKEREQIITNNLQAEPKNKSYTNTVSSKEFQAYLKAKGLALVTMGMNGKVASSSNPSTEPSFAPAANKRTVMALRSVHQQQQPVIAVNGNKKPSVFHRLLSRNRVPIRVEEQQRLPHPMQMQHSQMHRKTAPPQRFSIYSNIVHDGSSPIQRHSTPIKSTVPPPSIHEHQRQLGRVFARDTAAPVDNNLTNHTTTTPTTTENIYESTDRLQNLRLSGIGGGGGGGANNEVVLRNPQSPVKLNNNQGSSSQLRSMPRSEIYAHLYAFYQKSKRSSVSSESTLAGAGRSHSRNSGTK